MTFTPEERAEIFRLAEKEAARKAAALTPDEKETLISLAREAARKQGPMPPLALKKWASELLGRELPGGELHGLMRAQQGVVHRS